MNSLRRRTGEIVSIRGTEALVRVKRDNGCQGCSCSAACHPMGKDWMVMTAENKVLARVGQKVEVVYPAESELKASAILYLFPLFGLIGGALLGAWADFLGNEDASAAVLALCGLGAAFLAVHLYSRRKYLPGSRSRPVIVSVQQAQGTPSVEGDMSIH